MQIFDANCPEFFAPNERDDYLEFLNSRPKEYVVCEHRGNIAGAYGVFAEGDGDAVLNWILLNPEIQGLGIGSKIMERSKEFGAETWS